jgi:hypothetical protein|tara:strand:- start:113 stop:373 length:261 start_codon:yes stop_codon:yes gene_type:complete
VIRLEIGIVYTGGASVEALAGPADLVAFEAEYSRSVAKFETELRITDILFLAWHSIKRKKQTDLPFAEWLDTVEDFTMDGADEVTP